MYPMLSAMIYRSRPFSLPLYDYICKYYSTISSERLLKETDINDLENAVQESKNSNQYLTKDITLETILDNVHRNSIVIVWVCFDILYGRTTEKGFNAHYIIITGFDQAYVYIHECGGIHNPPEANKQIPRDRFLKALGPDPNFMVWTSNSQR